MTPAFVRLSLWYLLLLLIAGSPARGETSSTHTFSFDARGLDPRPATVHLAGSFNGWSREATPMKDDGAGVFRVEVPLAEGTYHYKFVLNGDKWVNDPTADKELEIDDGHGGKNSGLVIGPDARKLPPARPDDINVDALVHAPGELKDLNVSSGNTVRFRLRAQAGDVQEALVNIDEPGGVRTYPLRALGDRRLGIESFGGFVSIGGAPARYWFTLYDGKCKVLFTPDGKRIYGPDDAVEAKPSGFPIPSQPAFDTPDWARHAVWYQIFPERFRNADPSNDPGGQWFEHPVRWQADWWKAQPGEAPGEENFYKGQGNVWKRRYGGDIQGIRQSLPYLRNLGVNAIYLNPIFEAESMHKYDTADFRHIDDNFGKKGDIPIPGETDDPATWKWSESDRLFLEFLEEAHRQGFKVVLDGVFNHVGKAHPFFQDVLKNGKNSKYADWFEITDWGTGGEPGTPGGIQWKAWDKPNGHLPVFKKDPTRGLAPGPYEHVMHITRRWLAPDGDPTRGIDGWRLDVPGDIPHPFWVEWRKLVKSIKPDAYITGELWDWSEAWLQGDQFDAVMNYRFAVACQDFFVNQKKAIKPSEFNVRLVELQFRYPLQVAMVNQNLFDSHDTDRLASMFVNPDLAYDAANRLQDNGPQYSARKPDEREWQRMRQAVAFQMAFLGAPMIYYGSEAGMWSPDDPSNRQPMVWKDLEPYDDPQVRFDAAQFKVYQRAIAARSALPPLRTGFFRPVEINDAGGVYSFVRELNDQHVYVVINRSDRSQATTINVQTGGRYVDWLDPEMTEIRPPGSDSGRPALSVRAGARLLNSQDGLLSIDLKPHGVAILSKAP